MAPRTDGGVASVVVGAEDADKCGRRNGLKCQNYDSVMKYPNNGGAKNPVVIGTQGAKGATTVAAKTNGCVTSVVVGAQNGDEFGRGNGSKYQYCNSAMNPAVSWAARNVLSPNHRRADGYKYYRPTRP